MGHPLHWGELPTAKSARELDQVPDPTVDVEDEVISRVMAAELHEQMGNLTPRERRVLELYAGMDGFDRELSQDEIAQEIGLSKSTVCRSIHKGIGRLRVLFEVEDD